MDDSPKVSAIIKPSSIIQSYLLSPHKRKREREKKDQERHKLDGGRGSTVAVFIASGMFKCLEIERYFTSNQEFDFLRKEKLKEREANNPTFVSMFRCFDVSMFRCFDVSMFRCFDVSMFRCFDVSTFSVRCRGEDEGRKMSIPDLKKVAIADKAKSLHKLGKLFSDRVIEIPIAIFLDVICVHSQARRQKTQKEIKKEIRGEIKEETVSVLPGDEFRFSAFDQTDGDERPKAVVRDGEVEIVNLFKVFSFVFEHLFESLIRFLLMFSGGKTTERQRISVCVDLEKKKKNREDREEKRRSRREEKIEKRRE